jgi:RNA polymerase sigma-70 factor, ECF subfamily
MDRPQRRSTDVQALAQMERPATQTAAETPRDGIDFDELYRSSRDDVYAYVAGLLRDRSAAEEVTATAFERAYRRRRRFDAERGSPRGWLFGIARNAALDELRRRGRQAEMAGEPADPETAIGADEAESSLQRAALASALAELSPRERELVALKFFAGLSNAGIAGVLGVSESNAGTRLHRVVAKLREACDEK